MAAGSCPCHARPLSHVTSKGDDCEIFVSSTDMRFPDVSVLRIVGEKWPGRVEEDGMREKRKAEDSRSGEFELDGGRWKAFKLRF